MNLSIKMNILIIFRITILNILLRYKLFYFFFFFARKEYRFFIILSHLFSGHYIYFTVVNVNGVVR